jgi:hypothetical protein
MVWAVIDAVQKNALLGKQLHQPIVNLIQNAFGNNPTRYARLISNNNQLIPHSFKLSQSFSNTIEQLYLVGMIDIAGVLNQSVIAVQKYRFIRHFISKIIFCRNFALQGHK